MKFKGTQSCSQEQPLLLEDLLEQEKREQEKQLHSQGAGHVENTPSSGPGQALLSDHDFERLKADVFSSGPMGQMPLGSPPPQGLPGTPLLKMNLHF